MQPVTAVLVGAGQRGRHVFGRYAVEHPADLQFVAVVDPDPDRRRSFSEIHGIRPELQFATHEPAIEVDAEAWIVASPDRAHLAPALSALHAGTPVLAEKPLAASPEDAAVLTNASLERGVLLVVAHVLRYTPFFASLHDVIASGRLGDIVTVEHRENVVAWHMAHSFVRGNWSRTDESVPMIVAKCCHDFDILAWNLPPVRRLTSTGSLLHFRPENAPAGATERCTDPCPADDCPFDARRIYLDPRQTGWPVHVITDDLSGEGRLEALRTGPYGRCVYLAGSDVVDHQIVTMELETGASATLVMHGHSHEEARTMRYDGTRATLRAVFGRHQTIEVTDHHGGATERVLVPPADGGHGGGDWGAVRAFIRAVRTGEPPATTAAHSLESHLLAFAAEEARVEHSTVTMADYRTRVKRLARASVDP